MDLDRLRAELARDEGLRLRPYTDTTGHLTVGVGRNLTDVGISEDEAQFLLVNDIARAMEALDRALPWWQHLDDVRARALLNMCFNLGIKKLLGFVRTLSLLEAGYYEAAANELAASLWHRQVGERAVRIEQMFRTGKDAPA